jgi:hypothetical protein
LSPLSSGWRSKGSKKPVEEDDLQLVACSSWVVLNFDTESEGDIFFGNVGFSPNSPQLHTLQMAY